MANDNFIYVAAQHRAIPHARMRADGHVAEHDAGFGDVNAFAKARFLGQERLKLLFDFGHKIYPQITRITRIVKILICVLE
jgi:hypothetical protein